MGTFVSRNRVRWTVLAVWILFIFSCAGPGDGAKYSNRLKADLPKLQPEKEIELPLVPIDYTDEEQDRGEFSEDDLEERFEDSPKTTVFKGSFFVMNNDQLGDVDEKISEMAWAQHGNWCGPNRAVGKDTPEPVDPLDRACKMHKVCNLKNWDRNCNCDDKLIEKVASLENLPEGFQENMIEYYSHSRCIFKCRYMAKWKDGYIFHMGEGRIPKNIKSPFSGLAWGVSKLGSGGTMYSSISRDFNNYICMEDSQVFKKFVECARNRAGSLYRLQCLKDSYVKKGLVMDLDLDAEAVRDTNINP